jgi:hypothetical protein
MKRETSPPAMGAGEEVSLRMQTQAVVAAMSAVLAQTLAQRLQQFLSPLLLQLDEALDKRLVRTFAGTVQAIVQVRNRASGLLLPELGGVLLSPEHAPARTKRLNRLLHSPAGEGSRSRTISGRSPANASPSWRARARLRFCSGTRAYWRSLRAWLRMGLGSVRSTKAARLKRIKPGHYTRPRGHRSLYRG